MNHDPKRTAGLLADAVDVIRNLPDDIPPFYTVLVAPSHVLVSWYLFAPVGGQPDYERQRTVASQIMDATGGGWSRGADEDLLQYRSSRGSVVLEILCNDEEHPNDTRRKGKKRGTRVHTIDDFPGAV